MLTVPMPTLRLPCPISHSCLESMAECSNAALADRCTPKTVPSPPVTTYTLWRIFFRWRLFMVGVQRLPLLSVLPGESRSSKQQNGIIQYMRRLYHP